MKKDDIDGFWSFSLVKGSDGTVKKDDFIDDFLEIMVTELMDRWIDEFDDLEIFLDLLL